MSISTAFTSGLKFAVLGAGLGGAVGILKTVVANSQSSGDTGQPASLRSAIHVKQHDDVSAALQELAFLRYHAPDIFDDVVARLDKVLLSEKMVSAKASENDRRGAAKWRMEAKRGSDMCVNSLRKFRIILEDAHPGALQVFDEQAGEVQEAINGALHNILLDSSAMLG